MRVPPNRRDILKASAATAAAGAVTTGLPRRAAAREPEVRAGAFAHVDAALRAATSAGDLSGIVAMAATDTGIVYEGVFGERRLHDGPAMTRDTVFGVASMVKLITTIAALRLVERGKLALDQPAPDIDPALSAPQVLDGFDNAGKPKLRPAKAPILLRHLLTHTSGFTYRLWDPQVLQYLHALEKLPASERASAPHAPLMFDPGERWQYGPSIDWVGRIVEAVSGEPLDVHFRSAIFDPLGMKDTAFVITPEQHARKASGHRRQPDGSLLADPPERQPEQARPARQKFSGGGGIHSTAPDYLTLIRMLLHGGTLDGTRILRPETVALMGENQIGRIEAGVLRTTTPALSNDVDFFPGISLKWGYGHMINMQPVPEGRGAGSLTWAGLLNTYYWIDPKKRVAAVFMTQVLPFADHQALRVYRQFERGLYAAMRA
jgi:CubicO group peptidase (beta-lactamase class C family)